MASVDASASMAALGLDDEKKKRPISADASMAALGLRETTAAGLGKTAIAAVPKAAMNIAGLAGDVTSGPLNMLAQWLAQKYTGRSAEDVKAAADKQVIPWLPNNLAPTSSGMREQLEKLTGPLYDPQTRAEKVVDTGVQMTVGMGRPTASALAKIVAPATAGTEVAGAMTDDSALARFGGGLLGGGIPAMVNAWRGVPGKAIQQAVGDISPQQINDALRMQQQGRSIGGLMGAESMPNSGLQQLASDVMASRTGAPIMRKFLEQRPDRVKQEVGGLLDSIAPQRTPEAAAGLAQEAATKVVSAAEKARTAAVNPHYQAARKDVIGPDTLEGISQALRNQKPFFELPEQQSALAKLQRIIDPKQGMNATAMENLYKTARDGADVGKIGVSSADKNAAAVLRPITPELKAAAEQSPNIAAGRQLYEQITDSTINPLVSGPVGRIAGVKSGGFDPANTPQIQRVLSELDDVAKVRPETIRETYKALNSQDKQAFPAVARTWLENSFDQATKRVQTGDNVKIGANFANDIRGTDMQRANFNEILKGVAQANGKNPQDLVKGANVLLETLSATGKVPGIGSQTAGRLGTQAQLTRNPVSATADILSSKPLGMMGRGADQWFNARRNKVLAEWLTAPDSVETIVKMAKLKPDGTTAKFYLVQLLNANKELQSEN